MAKILTFEYRNHRGEVRTCNVSLDSTTYVWFGHSVHHGDDYQCFIHGWDIDRKDYRDYAWKDIFFTGKSSAEPARYDAAAVMYSADGMPLKPNPEGRWVKWSDVKHCYEPKTEPAPAVSDTPQASGLVKLRSIVADHLVPAHGGLQKQAEWQVVVNGSPVLSLYQRYAQNTKNENMRPPSEAQTLYDNLTAVLASATPDRRMAKARQDAYEVGFADGKDAADTKAREEGYNEGYAEGVQWATEIGDGPDMSEFTDAKPGSLDFLNDIARALSDTEVAPVFDYVVGDPVFKYTGDYQLPGEVRGALTTKSGKVRYVVEHEAGFLHIYGPQNIRKKLT